METLKRTVERDRNCPAVLAWHIYNECLPSNNYAIRAAQACRSLDPGCLLSFADASRQDEALKEMVEVAGLSYYGCNQYEFHSETYVNRMRNFTDRPVVFTEWGGWIGLGNERDLKLLCDTFVQHSRVEAAPRVAGCSFWAWADYEEYSRAEPASIHGWTTEGLLDQQAHPRTDWQVLSLMCFDIDHPPVSLIPKPEILIPIRLPRASWQSVSLSQTDADQAVLDAAVAAQRSRFTYRAPEFTKLLVAGIDFECRNIDGKLAPLLLGQQRNVVIIPIAKAVRGLAILGQVALQGGYPYSTVCSVFHQDAEPEKQLGSDASWYEFVFADGTEKQPLQHGIHILRSNNICRWWKTAPRAPQTIPAVQTVLHPSYEILRFDLWERNWTQVRYLKEIRWHLTDENSIQAMLALSVHTE